MMAFAGFAEEHRLNAAAGTESFFDQAHALNADESVFRGQAAAESHAELLEPAIVATGEERGLTGGASASCDLTGCSHYRGA